MKNCDKEKFYAVMSLIQGDKTLINQVRKFPFIYDQKHEYYKDLKLKEETWNKIGESINVKAMDAKNRWRNLRDRYVREKKILLTEGEDAYRRHEVWPYLEDMSFLWDLIVHRKTRIPGQTKNNAENEYEDKRKSPDDEVSLEGRNLKIVCKPELRNLPALIPKPMHEWLNGNHATLATAISEQQAVLASKHYEEEVIEVDPWIPYTVNENSSDFDGAPTPPQSKLRKILLGHRETSQEADSVESYNSTDFSPSSDAARNSLISYDEDELFCLSVAATLKRFGPKTKAAIKIKMQQVLYEAEVQEERNGE